MASYPQEEPILRTAASWYSSEDPPARCRQRRRRRMEMRRERPSSYLSSPPPLPLRRRPPPLPLRRRPPQNPMPVFSSISIKGIAEINADGAVYVEEDFCRPFAGGEPLHFFAVYDGHASAFCKQLMHRIIVEELARVVPTTSTRGDTSATQKSREWWNDHLLSALQNSFLRMDRAALEGSGSAAKAAVAVLTAKHIVVACGSGSSRAVLCSDGIPIPLSIDRDSNKPHHDQGLTPDLCEVDGEMIRNDYDHNGQPAYEILDVFRPLAENNEPRSSNGRSKKPEIFMIERSKEEDECLILASDGVWDVISDDIACNVAKTCLKDGHSDNAFDHRMPLGHQTIHNDQWLSCVRVDAAALLCRLAHGRGSSGGISAIVVDLKEHYGFQTG